MVMCILDSISAGFLPFNLNSVLLYHVFKITCVFHRNRRAPFEVCTRQNEGLTDSVRMPQRLIRGNSNFL